MDLEHELCPVQLLEVLSTCGLYPCARWGGMKGDKEETDENWAKGLKVFEHIGINPVILSL